MPEKGSRHRPWFPFFASDFASTVRRWNAEQIGCYMLLLIEQWINEDVPQDETELARIHPDIPKHWKTKLQRKFPNGRNERLEEIRDDMMMRSAKNRDAALRRWGRDPDSQDDNNVHANGDALAHANADANAHASGDAKRDAKPVRKPMLSTPTSTSIETPTSKSKDKRSKVTDAMWKKFCDTYPKRSGPDPNKSARAKAERAVRNGAHWSDIMEGLRRYRQHCETSNIEAQFIMRKESFMNPAKEFWNSDYADIDPQQGVGVDTQRSRSDELISMSDILGIKRQDNETDDQYAKRLDTANKRRLQRLASQ